MYGSERVMVAVIRKNLPLSIEFDKIDIAGNNVLYMVMSVDE